PVALLREAVRITRGPVLIKDHTSNGPLSHTILRFMDTVGNARYGVALPYDYWPRSRWFEVFSALGFTPEIWRQALQLYPWPATWVFDQSLHFLARLQKVDPYLPQGRHACVRGPHDVAILDCAASGPQPRLSAVEGS